MAEKLLSMPLVPAEQAGLALAARSGDAGAFAELVKDCERTLYRVSRTVLRSDTDCADAVQEALAKAWLHIGALREPRYFRTWLVRILLNECYQQLRRNKRSETFQDAPAETGCEFTHDDLMDLRDALGSLPDHYRTALVLYHVEDMTVEEIARALRIPSGTVKSRLARARAKLSAAVRQREETV